MKNILKVLFATTLITALVCACSSSSEPTRVGMITDTGTIEDKSFNQGAWEGITSYKADKGTIEAMYLEPAGELDSDYLAAITTLHDSGHKIIVAPGFYFETVVNTAAERYTDTTFVLIDGITHTATSPDFVKHDNAVCILFNEQEAGFLAGIAATLSTKTNQLGFIGGAEIPAVVHFGIGFKAGVKYANKTYGTNAELKDENYLYQGGFIDRVAGKNLASAMYERGVDIIFSPAGMVGIGAIDETKERVTAGKAVWAIGIDTDQYDIGLLDSGKSVILTSAIKRVDLATYQAIDNKLQGTFRGGQVIKLTLADKAVGLPAVNPNLAADVVAKCKSAEEAVVAGTVKVPSTSTELMNFLEYLPVSVGSSWSYSRSDNGTQKQTITSSTNNQATREVLDTTSGKSVATITISNSAYYLSGINLYDNTGGITATKTYAPGQLFIPASTADGTNETQTVQVTTLPANTVTSVSLEVRVLGFETITVPAGTFINALKIQTVIASNTYTSWFALNVGMIRQDLNSNKLLELTSYNVK